MSISVAGGYLEALPLSEIAKYPDGPPKNAVPFAGYPQQHPAEKNKILLVYGLTEHLMAITKLFPV